MKIAENAKTDQRLLSLSFSASIVKRYGRQNQYLLWCSLTPRRPRGGIGIRAHSSP